MKLNQNQEELKLIISNVISASYNDKDLLNTHLNAIVLLADQIYSKRLNVKKTRVAVMKSDTLMSDYDLDEDFANVVASWFEYKASRQESYKSKQAIKSFITKLKNLSDGDASIAKEIIEQSFVNNYAGIFKIKKGFGENKKNTQIDSNNNKSKNISQWQ